MDRNLTTNKYRNTAWLAIHFRRFRERNRLRPQDYQRDEQVLVYEVSPKEAIARLARFKAEHAAGLR